MSDIISQPKALKLYGMADSYAELRSQGATGSATASMESSEWLIRHMVEAESTDRAIRSVNYQMHAVRFPIHRNLAGFDFSQSRVDESLIGRLATMQFTDAAQNVVLVGGTRGPAKPIWPQPPALQASNLTANECASTLRWTWSIRWNRRKPHASRANWHPVWCR